MDNLVVLNTVDALDLLGVLLGPLILHLCSLGPTHLELLVSLVQLGVEVVNIALGGGQLILRVLLSGESVVTLVGLEVTAAISPH
jgi:hypothetical protein